MKVTDITTVNVPLMLAHKDYYPGGMAMPNRNQEGAYRYAYQGQEKDPETGMEAFELRMWDARIGRWLTTDPYGQHFSPYLGMGNNPISSIDPDGGWETKWGRFWAWVGNGFRGKFYNSDVSTGQGKYGLAFDYGGGSGQGDLTGTFMATSGAALDSWNMNQEWGNWSFMEDGQGFDVDMIRTKQDNFFGKAENWMDNNKVISTMLAANIIYSIADDAYVYGTRNFTNSGASHLNNNGASPKEVYDAGLNTYFTILPSPLKARTIIPKYNIAQFNSFFKGTFIARLKPITKGMILRNFNNVTNHGVTKFFINNQKVLQNSAIKSRD